MAEWIGKVIGNVRIDQLLAHGGMAEVYMGTHLTLDRPVAIKVLHSFIDQDAGLRDRLQREAKVVAGFRHPNIVQVYDFNTAEGYPYIVMEYLNGPTLAVYLRDLHARGARLRYDQVAQLLRGPAAAIDYAHGLGVIHRDIKPGNIMLHGAADETLPGSKPGLSRLDTVVTDFGLMRIAGASNQTSLGTIAGTPKYMSPEQASGAALDDRTDIYSLGVVLYEMLAGRAPFDGDSTMTVLYKLINESPPPIPGISPKIQAVIDRALAKDPDDRYQSCAELAADFEAFSMQADEPTVLPPVEDTITSAAPATIHVVQAAPAPAPMPASPPRKIGWLIPAAVTGIFLLALGAGAALVLPKLGASASAPTLQNTAIAATSVPVAVTGGMPSAAGMLKIPAGQYQLGMDVSDQFHAAAQAVSLASFWIDQHLVTNEQYQAYLQDTGSPPPQVWPGDAKHPVRGVTWDQAGAYCDWQNKRLPTEAEWEAAGRGAGAKPPLFPWGNDPTDGGLVLQMPDQDTYEVGSLSFNVSSLGIFDLVGNVWQWVSDPYTGEGPQQHILRGGRFGIPQDLAYRIVVAPGDTRYVMFAGFRCASSSAR